MYILFQRLFQFFCIGLAFIYTFTHRLRCIDLRIRHGTSRLVLLLQRSKLFGVVSRGGCRATISRPDSNWLVWWSIDYRAIATIPMVGCWFAEWQTWSNGRTGRKGYTLPNECFRSAEEYYLVYFSIWNQYFLMHLIHWGYECAPLQRRLISPAEKLLYFATKITNGGENCHRSALT